MPRPDRPSLFSPETFARHDGAARYVGQIVRTRDPHKGLQRFPGLAPGAWGLLASGDTITAASGLTLGAGSVKLCDRSGTVYAADETVDVYNAGASIGAPYGDVIVALEWVDGVWSVCGCAAASGYTITHKVVGCPASSPLPLEGATVSWWTDSSKTVFLSSGVTDASGNATITLPGTGTYYREVSYATRFNTLAGNKVVSGSLVTDGMSGQVASGYICINCCAAPVKRTLTFTSAKFGTWTGDWPNSNVGGFTAGSNCNGLCPFVSFPVTIYPSIQSTSPNGCRPIITVYQSGIPVCPTSSTGGAGAILTYASSVSVTCPPSFSLTGTLTYNSMPAQPIPNIIGCSVPWTDTLTVTE